MAENPAEIRKTVAMMTPIWGKRNAELCQIAANRSPACTLCSRRRFRLSGSNIAPSTSAVSESPAEINGMVRKASASGAVPTSVAPMPGPMVKARPKSMAEGMAVC